MLRTIIVEDEPLSRLYLHNLLLESFPDIQVVSSPATEEEAVTAISQFHPDLVFLDIELQTGSGFGVVNTLAKEESYIIFTSAMDHHATALFQLSGVPYIQKPIDLDSLAASVEASQMPNAFERNAIALGHLRETLRNSGKPLSILLEGMAGPCYLPLANIVGIEALGKESRIKLLSGKEITAAYELKVLDALLKEFGFFRGHINGIINTREVKRVNGESEKVLMADNTEWPVSPKRIAELRTYLAAKS